MPRRKRTPSWKSSFALNSIHRRADELRLQAESLPPFVTAGKLARFLGFSKTPVLSWIRNKNLVAKKRGNRWVLREEQVAVLIDAAVAVEWYEPKRRKPFLKLRRMRRKVTLPSKNTFSVSEVARLFGCSRTTVRRAIESEEYSSYLKSSYFYRRKVTRRWLLSSHAFGRLVSRVDEMKRARTVWLPPKTEYFDTGWVARHCGVTLQTVRNLIQRGEIVAEKRSPHSWGITRKSLRDYLIRRITMPKRNGLFLKNSY